jgi:hypothetical protein
MSELALNIHGMHLQWPLLVGALAIVQWLLFVAISMAARAPMPESGIRTSERNLLISSALLGIVWIGLYRFNGTAKSGQLSAVEATALGTTSGSCSSVRTGMTSRDVQQRMGKPDEIRSEEDARGPGASILIYRGSRCAVHTLDERVDFID